MVDGLDGRDGSSCHADEPTSIPDLEPASLGMALDHNLHAAGTSSRNRIARALLDGCWCGAKKARVVRRPIHGGAVVVTIQCRGCGRALGGNMPNADHPGRATYAAWDESLVAAANAQERADIDARQAEWVARQRETEAERERRIEERQDYHDWCRRSPEWHALSNKVMWRSRRTCEACLAAPAETVHHLTYDYGKLPPAWHLRAVCHGCHDRLHADKRGNADEWCAC